MSKDKINSKKGFLFYQEVSEWAKKNNIKTGKQWYALGRSRPKGAPFNPALFFKDEWQGWPHFLGVGKSWDQDWATYDEASKWAQENNIKTKGQWEEAKRKRPSNIPSCPQKHYKKEFKEKGGWSVFLNNGRPPKKIDWVSYEEAQRWVKEQGIVTVKEWKEKMPIRPINIPSTPPRIYKEEFKKSGWSGFLNNGRAYHNHSFSTYQEASNWAKENNILTCKEFRALGNLRPTNIPSNPQNTYKNFKELGGWGAFFQTKDKKVTRSKNKKEMVYAPYNEASLWAKQNKIYTKTQWKNLGHNRPKNFPRLPEKTYGQEFTNKGGWVSFLAVSPIKNPVSSTSNSSKRIKKSRLHHWDSYSEASNWAQANNIKTATEWPKRKPSCYPAHPHTVYKEEWISWPVFLGTKREFLSYSEASLWAKSNGVDTQRKWQKLKTNRPLNIPSNPWRVYEKEWSGWPHFLQVDRVPNQLREYATYEEASQWAKDNNILTKEEWFSQVNKEKRPQNIPARAPLVYKKEWKSWPEFLGTPKIAGASLVERVLRLVLDSILNTKEDPHRNQRVTGKSGKLHKVDMAFPSINLIVEYDGVRYHNNPEKHKIDVEKTKDLEKAGWKVVRLRERGLSLLNKTWDMHVNPQGGAENKIIPLLKHIKKLSKSHKIKLSDVQEKRLLKNIQSLDMAPFWKMVGSYRGYASYEEASQWAQNNSIKTKDQWEGNYKEASVKLPMDPAYMYKDKWKNWPDFLKSGNKPKKKRSKPWLSYEKASLWAKENGIKDQKEWAEKAKTIRPIDIPYNPKNVYKSQWKSWPEFLKGVSSL